MPFPAIVENQDALNSLHEEVRKEYEPIEGGKFRLKVTGAEEVFAAPLKANNQALKTEKDALAEKLRPFEALNLKPEEIAALQTENGTLKQAKLANDGKVEELLGEANKQHQAELGKREEREKALLGHLSRHLVDSAAIAAITGAQGNPKLLMGVIAPSLKMVEENGQFHVRVVDENGQPRMTYKSGASAYMTIEDRVAAIALAMISCDSQTGLMT